jgi:hypothetical protein
VVIVGIANSSLKCYNILMLKVAQKAVKSRTLWTLVFMVVLDIVSVYGNLFNDSSITIEDVKIYNKTDIDKIDYEVPYISSVDESFLDLYYEVLSKMFPDPSKYEAVTMVKLVNEIR